MENLFDLINRGALIIYTFRQHFEEYSCNTAKSSQIASPAFIGGRRGLARATRFRAFTVDIFAPFRSTLETIRAILVAAEGER